MGRRRDRDREKKKRAEKSPFYNPFASLRGLLKESLGAKHKGPPKPAAPAAGAGHLAFMPEDCDPGPLEDLVAGRARLDLRLTDEYMEGAARGTRPAVLENLAEGRYSHQGFIDLHGLTADEAKAELLEFLEESYSLNLRCVLVVHGRGLSSPGEPVLKNMVANTLTTGAGKKIVKAFATARQIDGGPGATYVLLRKHKKKGVFPR